MSKFLLQKKKLLQEVYKKAKNDTTESSFSGILKSLENTLKEDFEIPLSYKTIETYYKSIVENNIDYNIKTIILNDLSVYLGFNDFKEFCERNPNLDHTSNIKVSIDGKNETSANTFSDIIINITNSPVFTIPEFVTKHKSSFGIVGILLLSGFFFSRSDYFKEVKPTQIKTLVDSNFSNNSNIKPVEKEDPMITKTIYSSDKNVNIESKNVENRKRNKECMYWDGDKYIAIYCDENLDNFHIEQINLDKLKLKKILQPDTLTSKNALGKVWYDKSNNNVEFFTYHGLNPSNNKTLKEVTPYILEKYCTK